MLDLDVRLLPLWSRMRQRNKRLPPQAIRRIGAYDPEGGKARAVGLAALLALLLAACADEGPEVRLRAAVAAMEAAVEGKQPGDFIEQVSADFTGGREGLDRHSLRGVLASQMLGSERIEVILGSPEIVLHGERATLTVDATVIGGRFLPERGERLRIVSGWRLEDGEWRCYTAEWTRS
jgi:hypothetical protein